MLPTLAPVLCAVDLSDATDHVLAHAVTFAGSVSAPLHVVHAVEPVNQTGRAMIVSVLGSETFEEHEAAVERGLLERLRGRLKAFAAAEGAGKEADALFAASHVERGRPSQAILDLANRLDAGVIVAGLNGQGGLQHVVLGSVARHLLYESNIPVLLVPLAPQP